MRIVMLALSIMVLAGCLSPYKEASGTYIKTAHSEFRSPFGTNNSFAKLQRCRGPEKVVLFYFEADFTDCKDLDMSETMLWSHGYSQGQGGQVVSGAMNAAALGGVAAAAGGAGNAVSSSTATVVNSITNKVHNGPSIISGGVR